MFYKHILFILANQINCSYTIKANISENCSEKFHQVKALPDRKTEIFGSSKSLHLMLSKILIRLNEGRSNECLKFLFFQLEIFTQCMPTEEMYFDDYAGFL